MSSSKHKSVVMYVLYGYAHKHMPRSYDVNPRGLFQTQRVMCVVPGGAHRQLWHTSHTISHTLVKSQERDHNDQPDIWLSIPENECLPEKPMPTAVW